MRNEQLSFEDPPWSQVIAAARKRGHFTDTEVRAAGDWSSCACRALLPEERESLGGPRDEVLSHLGNRFYGAVLAGKFFLARDLDAEIQARIKEIRGET